MLPEQSPAGNLKAMMTACRSCAKAGDSLKPWRIQRWLSVFSNRVEGGWTKA